MAAVEVVCVSKMSSRMLASVLWEVPGCMGECQTIGACCWVALAEAAGAPG